MSLATTIRPRTVSPMASASRLTSVAARHGQNAPRLRYVVASLIAIFAILGGQLLLSIVLSDGAYRILSLERELADRQRDLHVVTEDIGHMFDPQTVATLAVSMGMVTASDTAYVRLSDGSIVGESEPARAGSTAVVSLVPGAELSAEEAPVFLADSAAHEATGATGALAALTSATAETEAPEVAVVAPTTPSPSVPSSVTPSAAQPALGGSLPSPETR